jgi:hypothetical protein
MRAYVSHVCFGSKADMTPGVNDVCFSLNSRHFVRNSDVMEEFGHCPIRITKRSRLIG